MVVANNEINKTKEIRKIEDDFDGHGNAAVQSRAHCLMEHIQGFTVVLPQRPQWSTNLNKIHKTLTKHNF